MFNGISKDELIKKAKLIRIETIKSIFNAQSGHPGGSLSIVDILTVLYFNKMNINPMNPNWSERDRFILSKGHANPALYATLAIKGYFPIKELSSLRRIGSILSGHPSCFKTPGIDISTGSLGQGLSIGLGMSLAAKVKKKKYRVFVLIGDGELQEGEVWEAAMAAPNFKVSGLIAIIDNNKIQLDGNVSDIMEIEPIKDKLVSFNWQVIIADGHDIKDLLLKFDEAINLSNEGPVAIIANTIKGKGVSFMENTAAWHGKVINEVDFHRAMEELKSDSGGGME